LGKGYRPFSSSMSTYNAKITRKLKFILQRQLTPKNMNNKMEAARFSEVRELALCQHLGVQISSRSYRIPRATCSSHRWQLTHDELSQWKKRYLRAFIPSHEGKSMFVHKET
jgi:hypothetical protein